MSKPMKISENNLKKLKLIKTQLNYKSLDEVLNELLESSLNKKIVKILEVYEKEFFNKLGLEKIQ